MPDWLSMSFLLLDRTTSEHIGTTGQAEHDSMVLVQLVPALQICAGRECFLDSELHVSHLLRACH